MMITQSNEITLITTTGSVIIYETPFLYTVDLNDPGEAQIRKLLELAGRYHKYPVVPYNTGEENREEDFRKNKTMLIRIGEKYGWKRYIIHDHVS